jgi:hypothetical protein
MTASLECESEQEAHINMKTEEDENKERAHEKVITEEARRYKRDTT